MALTDDDLRSLSHSVLYDFEMIEALAKRLTDIQLGKTQSGWQERFKTTDADVRRAPFESYAMLESLLIHARSLTEFLFGNTRNVRADLYFSDRSVWRSSEGRGKRPSELSEKRLTDLVGREVAHVTEHRAKLVGGGSLWRHFAIYTAVAPVMERFASLAQPEGRVGGDFQSRVLAALPESEKRRLERRSDGLLDLSAPAPLAGLSVATQGLGAR